jgi:predicted transposase YdaD
MKTDKLFYRLFLSQPDLIGELLKLLVVDEAEATSLARSIVNSSDTEVEFQRRLDLVEAISS